MHTLTDDLLRHWKSACALCLLWLSLADSSSGIEISPSRYQAGTSSNNPPYKTQGAPSLFSSPFKWIFGSGHSAAMQRVNAPPDFKVELVTEPKNFMPSSNGVLKAKMIVLNQSKDKYILEFTTAQHYDFLIQDRSGKEVYRWSGDKAYSQQLSSVVVNRNEKLAYEEDLFTTNNVVVNLDPGEYKLIGRITAKSPISVETSFRVSP